MHWTPLHHLEQLECMPQRVRDLLRSGADLHDKHDPGLESPLERARALATTEAGAMVIRAAAPWSPSSHNLFPELTRIRACMLLRLGHLLAASANFEGETVAIVDAWLHHVMAHALSR